ncbi:hypothetical protein PBY51_008917 [Eleginops maclovinus]|nr:hypothetical protein PBY51_008917 [Eleginops maclovinus]
MDAVLSLKESESSLGTNKQAGFVGAGKCQVPPSVTVSHFIRGCDRVTVIYLQPSHSSPQAQTHTRGHTHTAVFSSPQPIRSTNLPRPDFKAAQPRRTQLGVPARLSLGSRGHGIKRTEIDLVSLVPLSPL